MWTPNSSYLNFLDDYIWNEVDYEINLEPHSSKEFLKDAIIDLKEEPDFGCVFMAEGGITELHFFGVQLVLEFALFNISFLIIICF